MYQPRPPYHNQTFWRTLWPPDHLFVPQRTYPLPVNRPKRRPSRKVSSSRSVVSPYHKWRVHQNHLEWLAKALRPVNPQQQLDLFPLVTPDALSIHSWKNSLPQTRIILGP